MMIYIDINNILLDRKTDIKYILIPFHKRGYIFIYYGEVIDFIRFHFLHSFTKPGKFCKFLPKRVLYVMVVDCTSHILEHLKATYTLCKIKFLKPTSLMVRVSFISFHSVLFKEIYLYFGVDIEI